MEKAGSGVELAGVLMVQGTGDFEFVPHHCTAAPRTGALPWRGRDLLGEILLTHEYAQGLGMPGGGGLRHSLHACIDSVQFCL